MKFSAFKRAAGRVTACLAVISALAACGGGDDGTPVVTTTSGQVVGNEESSLNAYLGIPYAAPPTGNLRWRAPAAPASWSGVRATQSFGNHCPQTTSPFGVASTNEDCLYLNVYTPKTPGPHPVMVWIHGGAFNYGLSNEYNPQRLVDQGTVVVTLNYRLGALGFMSHALLSAENLAAGGTSTSGNYGLMDQQAALRWVRDNIGGFGGNASNVTIFGESAGGFSVHSHIASPGSAGLFHKAIIMSGAYALDTQEALAAAQTKGATVAATVAGLTATTPCTTAACLRALPLASLLTAQSVVWPAGVTPSVDGSVLPQSVRARITAGTHNRVPVMQGSNKDEWRFFVAYDETLPSAYGAWRGAALADNDTAYSTALLGTFDALDDADPTLPARLIASVYPRASYGGKTSLAMGALGTDLVFSCNARVSSALQANTSTVYAYEFADQTAPSLFPNASFATAGSTGAEHTSELAYIFTLANRAALTSTQLAVANNMVAHWARFASTGNPNPAATPTAWPAWGDGADSVMSFNTVGTTLMTDAEFAAAHKCGTWTSPVGVTANGVLIGTPADTMVSFQGIPYAAPPTGALRWAAPTAPTSWATLRPAMSFASHCPQSAALGTGSTNEDCLYLNVYTPTKPGPHPVMVWFPGGAFVAGTAASYVPTALVQQDMVVVTVNYRLGALGFLTHPAGLTGNYGLMDQQQALRWVRDNIANFGGSPSNVTIFGESAGGLSVQAHLASAGSTGLFHKAVVQSGAYGFVNGVQTTSVAAETRWNAIPAVAACAGDLTCLRALDVSTLLAQQGAAFSTGPVPTIDGVVLTQSIYNTFRAGTHNAVPIMQGHTRDEYRYFVASSMLRGAFTPATDASTYATWVSTNVSASAAPLTALYPIAAYPNAGAAAGALGTDAVFTCPSRNAMLELAQHGSVYAFEFRDRTAPRALPAIPGFDQGAAHATELTYLFTMASRGALNADQQALSGAMVRYWSRFARNGNPNGGTDPTWSAISGSDPVHLGLDIGAGGIAPLSGMFSSTAPSATAHFCQAYAPS